MAGRPTRLRDERTHQAKPYQKRKSVLQTVTSAVRQFLTPSWLSETSCESDSGEERPELTNGEREPAPFVPLAPQPVAPQPAPPRPTRDCGVGPDDGDGQTTEQPAGFSVPVVPRPETSFQPTMEWSLVRPSLRQLPERLCDRSSNPLSHQLSTRPASTLSPSSWISAAASSSKRQKLWHEESPLQSPFYSGQTTYGGAAAQNRLRMLAKSQSSMAPVVARGAKSAGAAAGLSNTTRQILATLEKMSTPVSDAKRVPLKSRQPSSHTWTLLHRRDPPTPTQGGPPIRSAARPALRTVAPARTETSRVEVSRVESIRTESSCVDALRATGPRGAETLRPEVSRVEALRQDASRMEPLSSSAVETRATLVPAAEPKPMVAPSWEPSPSNRKRLERDSGGGKMVRVIHSAHAAPIKMGKPPAEPEDELPPHLPLPPIRSLPSFSFNLKPQEPAPTNTGTVSGGTPSDTASGTASCTGSSRSNGSPPADPEFSFSKPRPMDGASAGLVAQLEDDEVFQFSKPWGPNGEKEQQSKYKDLPNDAVQGLSKVKEAATKEDHPAQASSVTAEGTKDKDEACKEKDEKNGNSATKGGDLWERFKPPAGSWSCLVCMVSNQASASRCQACDEPRPTNVPAPTAVKTSASILSSASAEPAPPALPPPPPASATHHWECNECWVRNLPNARRCVSCETPRASASGPTSAVTTGAAVAAAAATTITTTATTAPAVGAATASRWECDTCLVRNVPDAVRCIACETPRACAGSGNISSTAATAAAAAAFSFTLPASSGTGGFGGVPFSTADTAAKPFKFGIPTSVSAKSGDTAASTECPAKPFSFCTITEEAPKTFKFGSSTEQLSKTFNFGSSATEAPSKVLKFGCMTEESTTKAFKFGSATEEPTTKTFKFGGTPEEPATQAFKFGGTSEELSVKESKVGETAPESVKMFTFGTNSGVPAQLSTTIEGPAKPSDISSSTEQPAKAVKYGCTTEEPAKSSQPGPTQGDAAKPFGLGSTGEEPVNALQPATTSVTESADDTVKFAPTASEPSNGFSFGQTVKNPAKPFTFGSAPSEVASPGFKFSSSTAETAEHLKLGSSEQQSTKNLKLGAPPATEPAKLFQFGAPTGDAPKFGTPAGEAPKFGAPADAPTKPFSFGLPTTVAAAAQKPFTFGMAEKTTIPPALAPTEQLQANNQGAGGSGQLPGPLSGAAPLAPAMPESSLSAVAPQTVEPPKPAFPPTSQFVFGQKADSGAGTFSFGSQGAAPPNFASPLSVSTSLPSFGTLTPKPLEPQLQPVAPQPVFGIGSPATAALTFGAISAPKTAVTTAVAPTATGMQGGFGCQPTPSTGFGLPAAAPPTQPSFVFRPPASTAPVTFQFGSTGPTTGGVFRFGAQPSQPSTPLQQQPQQQQPAQEAFGAPFGQTAPMQFGMPSAPSFGMPESENPFSATGSSGGPMAQRRIRKAIRRKPTPR